MKIKLIFLLILTHGAILFGTSNLTPYKDGDSKRKILINNITESVAKKLLLEDHLLLVGTGGQMMDEIEMLGIAFDYAQEVDLSKARHLLITAVQSYLDTINQSKELRRYLKKYPFTANNIEVGICVHEPDGSNVPKDKLFFLSAVDGILYYYLDNIKGFPRIVFHQETYDNALKVVSDSKNKHIAPSFPEPTAHQKS